MTPTLRKNFANVALVAAAVVFGLWVWSTRGSITDTERDMRKNNVFPAFRRDEIAKIELHGEKGDVVLERADGGDAWMLASPTERADSHAVDGLIGAFEFATRIRSAPDDAPGLGKPRVRGTLSMGRVSYSFVLGDPAPTPPGAAYFRLEGEGASVVSADLAKSLLDDVATYRNRTVVPYLSIELARMEIRDGQGKGFTIERIDDVAFRLPDAGVRASRDALDTIWLALAEMRASSFLTDEEADRASKPELTIKMAPRDGARTPGELTIGGPCPNHADDTVLVRKTPTRTNACVPGGLIARLRASPVDLADRRLFVTRLDEVESIRIAALPSGLAIDLARKGNGWTLRAPETRDLASDEADMATALIGSILHGEGTFAAIPGGTFTPSSRVTVVRAESHAEEIVESDGKVLHRLQDVTSSTLAAELARKLKPSLVALRGRAVWSPSVEGQNYAGLALHCDGIDQELGREISWSYKIPAGMPADEAAALDVADAIARVKAEAWIAEQDDGSFGFEKKSCSGALTVTSDAGARTVKLSFGRETESGVFAHVEGQAPILVVSRAVRDAMTRLLVDRGALAIDTAKLSSVELRRGGKSVVLSGADADALAQLRADDVVHFGPPIADEGFADPTLEIRASGAKDARIHVGRATLRRDQKMYFARIDGVDATFAVAKERIEPLLDPLGGSK
jgi:hypothetical protein